MKKSYKIKFHRNIQKEDLIRLYDNVQWTAYTKDVSLLQKAILQSLDVISIWDATILVGLIRTIGDGLTILYIQDILILKEYQRQGLGSFLLHEVLEKYHDVRQIVLMTDDKENTRTFYNKNGFESCDKGKTVAFATYNIE